MNVNFISNSKAKKHSIGRFHPESAQRIEAIEQWLQSQSDEKIQYEVLDQQATKEDIQTIHSANHYELIEKTKGVTGHFYFDADTGANDHTFEAASQAVAVGKKAILESNSSNSIFALVRPPGHHATRSSPGGFCIFNNIAIAAELAIQQNRFSRIAIIDFDQHFGNGTAYIHERNPDILYVSTHADPRISYPGCGWVDEIGEDDGRGYNICVPLGYRASEADLQVVFEQLILPILFQFKPQFLAISSGFDGYEKDPIGVLGITSSGFSIIGSYIHRIISDLNIPFANFLEGGYNIQMLPRLVMNYIDPLIHPEKDYNLIQSLRPNTQTIDTIDQAKSLLKDFWEL
jgi:acetoin utilization deacetylase AcuC-like enzyme